VSVARCQRKRPTPTRTIADPLPLARRLLLSPFVPPASWQTASILNRGRGRWGAKQPARHYPGLSFLGRFGPYSGEKFLHRENLVSESGVRNLDRRLMRFLGKLNDPVPNKGKVIAQLRCLASGA
jgi:hypothetical protein